VAEVSVLGGTLSMVATPARFRYLPVFGMPIGYSYGAWTSLRKTMSADVTLEGLRLLVSVAEHGSISAAAREAQISQPSASARMKDLERRLGLELLDRRTRGAELSADGRAVIDLDRTVVDDYEG